MIRRPEATGKCPIVNIGLYMQAGQIESTGCHNWACVTFLVRVNAFHHCPNKMLSSKLKDGTQGAAGMRKRRPRGVWLTGCSGLPGRATGL